MKRTPLWPVGIFTGGYVLAATPFALAQQNTEFLFYIGIVLILAVFVLLLHLRVHLSPAALWALSIWGLLHMLGGLVELPASWPTEGGSRVLYSFWIIPAYLKYDHPVHAYGFGVCTWICWHSLRSAVPNIKPSIGILLLCALAGMGLGALNEIVEFSATLLLPGTNVGGFVNTGWDLVSNLAGCLMAATLISMLHRSR